MLINEYLVQMGYAFALCFIFYKAYGIVTFWYIKRVASGWSKVRAKLIDARIVDQDIDSGKPFRKVKLIFFVRYKIKSVLYGSNQISLYKSNPLHDTRALKKVIASEEKYINIYIDPAKPYNSVLIPPKDHLQWLDMLKMFLTLIGLIVIYLYQGS